MEESPLQQKKSGINRVVGFGPKKEVDILQYFENLFGSNITESVEKEKTDEQKELIRRINDKMKEFLARYGVEAIEVPLENIHILDRTKFTEEQLNNMYKKIGTEHGFYSATHQGVVILRDYDESKLFFLQVLVHEILHLQGFFSYQKSQKESADIILKDDNSNHGINIRRSGFSIGTMDDKRLIFHKFDESIITELEIRFGQGYISQWTEVSEEIKARDECIKEVSKRNSVPIEEVQNVIMGIRFDKVKEVYKQVSYGYHKERQQFNDLVDRLYEKNKDDFQSREQVFNLFAVATLTGRLLPVARLIEKTFGKGSFRKIGNKTVDKSD